MFSKRPNKIDVNVNSYSEIHEHRAPTDDSVRLLKEMQESIERKVVSSIKLQDNNFEAHFTIFNDFETQSYRVRSVVKVNGTNISADTYYQPNEDIMDVLEKVRCDLGKRLASKLVSDHFWDAPLKQLLETTGR